MPCIARTFLLTPRRILRSAWARSTRRQPRGARGKVAPTIVVGQRVRSATSRALLQDRAHLVERLLHEPRRRFGRLGSREIDAAAFKSSSGAWTSRAQHVEVGVALAGSPDCTRSASAIPEKDRPRRMRTCNTCNRVRFC